MLEFASAFLPEAAASIKDDLGPHGPLHFQKNPSKAWLPPLPGRGELRQAVDAAGQGSGQPYMSQSHWDVPAQPQLDEPLEVSH